MIGSFFVTLANALLIIVCAPIWQGMVSKFAAIMSGAQIFPVLGRWRDLIHQARRQSHFSFMVSFCVLMSSLLVLATSFTVPFFVFSGNEQNDVTLLAISFLLLSALYFRWLTLGYSSGSLSFFIAISLGVTFLDFLLDGRGLSAILLQHRHFLNAREHLAFFIIAIVFFIISLLNNRSLPVERHFSGLLLSLWRWSGDMMCFCWMVLACDFLWPTSLALPLSVVEGDPWFLGCFKSLLYCFVKMVITALGVAAFNVFCRLKWQKAWQGGGVVVFLCILAFSVCRG